jgi:DNA-binding NtrC family response regulator
MKCPKCNLENREEAIFCKECGQGLAIKCPGCSNATPGLAKFCDKCGRSLQNLQELRDKFEKSFGELTLTEMGLREARDMFEKIYLEKKLEEFDWNISRLAEAIGIERSNLHRKIKRYKLKAPLEKQDTLF